MIKLMFPDIMGNWQIHHVLVFGSTSLCENSATHEALHVDNLLTRGHPQAAAAARPENSGDEYVAQLSWFCGDDYQQLMVAVIVG